MLNWKNPLHLILSAAIAALVLNDVVRLAFPVIQQSLIEKSAESDSQDDDNPINPFSIFEEEVKHTNAHSSILVAIPEPEPNPALKHLVKDDEVRHLAYIPVFSPPPDLV